MLGSHHTARAPTATPGTGDWMALRAALSTHKLIRPRMRVYPVSKELFDPRFDYKRSNGDRVLRQSP